MISHKKKFLFFISALFFSLSNQALSAENNYIKLTNIKHNISSDGKLLYTIKADKGYLKDLSSSEFILDKIELLWFEGGIIKLKTTSDKGVLDKKTGNIKLENNVRLYSEDYQMTCDYMFYNNKSKRIRFNGNVFINSENISFSAKQGSFTTITRVLELQKNIIGKIKFKGDNK